MQCNTSVSTCGVTYTVDIVWHDIFTRVTCLIHICDMTHSQVTWRIVHVWHDFKGDILGLRRKIADYASKQRNKLIGDYYTCRFGNSFDTEYASHYYYTGDSMGSPWTKLQTTPPNNGTNFLATIPPTVLATFLTRDLNHTITTQVTLWGPRGEIADYASKQWNGLIGDYYLPRWQLFFQKIGSVICFIRICDMTQSCVTRLIGAWHDSFIFFAWLVAVACMHSSVRSYVTWLIHMWRDSFVRDITHSYVTWLIHVWRDSFVRDITHSYVTWLIHVWRDSFVRDMWTSWWMPTCHSNESCHIWMSHVTHKWVTSHMNESCHIWTNCELDCRG